MSGAIGRTGDERKVHRMFFKNLPKGYVSNAKFAETDANFHACCIKAGVDATARQASKFRNRKGSAWKYNTKGDVLSPREMLRG